MGATGFVPDQSTTTVELYRQPRNLRPLSAKGCHYILNSRATTFTQSYLCPPMRAPLFLLLPLLLTAATLGGCAVGQSIPPPGGPPDTTAPGVVGTTPASGTLNFIGRTVTIEFDEEIQQGDLSKFIVITPPPPRTLTITWDGDEVEIEFREPLPRDRTYTLSIGSQITDAAGNRLARPATIRFSTGSTIDSGRISGEVYGKARNPAFVVAWPVPGTDSSRWSSALRPDSLPPDFIAPVGDDGRFTLEGLPTGTFRLAVWEDTDADRIYTPGNDAYGTAVSDVAIASQTSPVSGVRLRIRPAPNDITPPSIYSALSLSPTMTQVRLSEPPDTASISPATFTIESGGQSIRPASVWIAASSPLTLRLRHTPLPPDTQGTVRATGIRDTAGNSMPDSSASSSFTVTAADAPAPQQRFIALSADSTRPYTLGDSILLGAELWAAYDGAPNAITLQRDSTARTVVRVQQIGPARFILRPVDTLFGATRGALLINLRHFMEGRSSDSIVRVPLAMRPPRQLGALEGNLRDSLAPDAQHVIALRDRTTGAVYKRILSGVGRWEMRGLPEGEYDVEAWRDTDRDALHDAGSLLPWRFAEPYTVWRGGVRVRPRWTVKDVNLSL